LVDLRQVGELSGETVARQSQEGHWAAVVIRRWDGYPLTTFVSFALAMQLAAGVPAMAEFPHPAPEGCLVDVRESQEFRSMVANIGHFQGKVIRECPLDGECPSA